MLLSLGGLRCLHSNWQLLPKLVKSWLAFPNHMLCREEVPERWGQQQALP